MRTVWIGIIEQLNNDRQTVGDLVITRGTRAAGVMDDRHSGDKTKASLPLSIKHHTKPECFVEYIYGYANYEA